MSVAAAWLAEGINIVRAAAPPAGCRRSQGARRSIVDEDGHHRVRSLFRSAKTTSSPAAVDLGHISSAEAERGLGRRHDLALAKTARRPAIEFNRSLAPASSPQTQAGGPAARRETRCRSRSPGLAGTSADAHARRPRGLRPPAHRCRVRRKAGLISIRVHTGRRPEMA